VWLTERQAPRRAEQQGGGASNPERGRPGGWQRQEAADRPGGPGRGGPRADRPGQDGPLVALLCPEPRLRRILRLALESDGYRLVEWNAISPAVAVEALVVDLDGLGWRPPAALAALGAAGLTDPPALLLISVYPAEAGAARGARPLEYLQPPFSPREFVTRLGRLLERAPGRLSPPAGDLRPAARASDL
jgi:hypothetical protein